MTLEPYAEVGGVELTERELKTLLFVHQYVARDPLRRPPSHPELLEHLNEVLEGAKLVSTQQTQRVIESLRDKGLVLDPEKYPEGVIQAKTRNMLLTPAGTQLVRRWLAQQE